ncbi:hypothetical protein JYU34_013389, partial [Plutella xylostella]
KAIFNQRIALKVGLCTRMAVLNIVYLTLCVSFFSLIYAQFVFFESFGSSYKRSFVEFKGRLCDLFNDSLLTTLLADTGYTCPVPPGKKYMRNMTLTKTLRSLRSVKWPFRKAKVEGIVSQTYTKEIVGKGSIVLNFK